MINTEAQIYFLLHYYHVKTEYIRYQPPEYGIFARFTTLKRISFSKSRSEFLAVLVTRPPDAYTPIAAPRCFNFPQVIKCLQLQ